LKGNTLKSVLRAYTLQHTPFLDEIGPKFEKCPPGKTRFNLNKEKKNCHVSERKLSIYNFAFWRLNAKLRKESQSCASKFRSVSRNYYSDFALKVSGETIQKELKSKSQTYVSEPIERFNPELLH
jgi:hypothetical protein